MYITGCTCSFIEYVLTATNRSAAQAKVVKENLAYEQSVVQLSFSKAGTWRLVDMYKLNWTLYKISMNVML
jgi:hypothetical protein